MKTPMKYTKLVNKGIITEEILEAVLYSLNKRAKNCRDKKIEYYQLSKRLNYSKIHDDIYRYKQKEKYFYDKKEYLLKSILKPISIYKISFKEERVLTYYDYENEYYEIDDASVIRVDTYFDQYTKEYIEYKKCRVQSTKNQYFLFYKTKNASFHLPISEMDVVNYNLPIIQLKELNTTVRNSNELISLQFCYKVLALVKSGDYKYIEYVDELCA